MKARTIVMFCSVSAVALMTACSANPPRNEAVMSAPVATAPAASGRQFGNVSSIDTVPIAARTSGGGAVLGAVLGAVIGNQVGSGTGRAVATGAGAVGGGVIGNQIEKRNQNQSDIYRVGVRLDNGRIETFEYQRIDDLRVGDRVKVEDGQLHRV